MYFRKGFVRQQGGRLGLLHRLLDAALIALLLWGCATAYGIPFGMDYKLAGVVGAVVFLFLAEWQSLYESWRGDSIRREAWAIIFVWLLTVCVMLALGFLWKSSVHYSRVVMMGWVIATPALLMLERMVLRYFLRALRRVGLNSRSVAIVGGGEKAAALERQIASSPWMGLHLQAHYDDQASADKGVKPISSLFEMIHEGAIDSVYVTYPIQEERRIRKLVEQLADTTVSVYIVPDIFVSDLFHARWTNLGDVPLVSVFESPMYGTNELVKRLEDVVLGLAILLIISPIMLAIAATIKATSSGPVIFKQRRYGLNGQVIEVWKFRSMTVMEDDAEIKQAKKIDPRITPFGTFLRRTSLDELPQFFNVLQGSMSIVGPRPHAVAHNEQYRKLIHGYMLRHKVKPGITGWAQVNGWRGETDTIDKMEKRVQFDLYYINNWSFWFDLKIIFRTILGGMRGTNAY
ncbi:MAG: undecaprenyl-phosphate glucose phosphotransferase [Pseudomonadota bacterium]